MKPRVRKEERVPSLSGKEAAVLDLLLAKPSQAMYGLELVNVSAGRLKRGTIYVTLDRMEDKGLVESKRRIRKRQASFFAEGYIARRDMDERSMSFGS